MTTSRVAISIVVLLGACRAFVHAQNMPPLDPAVQSTFGLGSAPELNYHDGSSISSSPPALRPDTFGPALGNPFNESTWYTREEYFHWNERFDRVDLVNESGLLITLGYQKRVGMERFRAELFGGTMDYVGGAQFDDGTIEPLSSKTGYLGLRGEYDFVFEPDWWPNASLLVGIGSRFWFRDLKDGATESGVPVTGYQETWWTIYPYLGLETRRKVLTELEFYGSSRLGATPLTYEHATWGDAVLYPRCGMTGQLEAGLRGQHLFCAAVSEVLTWRQSPPARGVLQPDSMLFTVGLKAGVNF